MFRKVNKLLNDIYLETGRTKIQIPVCLTLVIVQ